MEIKKDKRCLFMGLPSSGKSTFIGALWHVLKTKEVETLYKIETEPEDRAYLNSLQDAWLEFRPPERTPTKDLSNIVTVKVSDTQSGQIFDLVFPDASGEFYESQFAFRKLSVEYLEMIKSMEGILLFVNPEYLIKSNLITQAGEIFYDRFFEEKAELLGINKKSSGTTTSPSVNDQQAVAEVKEKPSYIEWEEKLSQSQVILVDLLQMIMDRVQKPCRIAFVVSAWDQIKNQPAPFNTRTPVQWFSKNLPLLKQFFASHEDTFTYSVFGVSAQGGHYDESPTNALYNIIVPSERIQVQVNNKVEHDITVPIKWVLNG